MGAETPLGDGPLDSHAPLAYSGPFCPWLHGADDTARPQPWTLLQRRLTHWLLVCSLDGAEDITVEGREYHIPEGASYLIQPGWLADLRSNGSRPAWVHFDLRFEPQRRGHPFAQAYDSELTARRQWLQPGAQAVWGVDLPVPVPTPLLPRFAAEIPLIIQRWREGGRLAGLDAANRVTALLVALVGQVEGAGAVDPLERIARAEALARSNLDTGFGITELAAAAGYGRSRFSELYRTVRGITPAAFLKAERLARAKALLLRPDLPIAKVGALVGYPDATVFGRIFRADTGLSPGAWREAHQL